MIPTLTDEMLISSTLGARLRTYSFEVDEEDEKMFKRSKSDDESVCESCRYLSARGTCLSAKCPHKSIKPNKEENKL